MDNARIKAVLRGNIPLLLSPISWGISIRMPPLLSIPIPVWCSMRMVLKPTYFHKQLTWGWQKRENRMNLEVENRIHLLFWMLKRARSGFDSWISRTPVPRIAVWRRCHWDAHDTNAGMGGFLGHLPPACVASKYWIFRYLMIFRLRIS